jgi:Cu/Ag efflux protein CusF
MAWSLLNSWAMPHSAIRSDWRNSRFIRVERSSRMKKTTIAALVLLLATSLAYAGQPKNAAPKVKTHIVNTEVVKADVAAKQITVKGPNNTEMTMPCQGKAIAELSSVKAGEKVDLVCQDNDKGEHQAIVGIKPAKSAKTKK